MRRIGGWTLGVMLAAMTLGAADSQTRSTTTPTGAPAGVPGAAAGVPTAAPATPTRTVDPRAQRAAGRGVNWPAAIGGLRASGGGDSSGVAPNLNRAAVDRTRVPILLPTDSKLLAGARIYSFGDYYAITGDVPGASVSFTGTTSVIPLPASKPLKITPVGPEGMTVQRTIDGQLVSFTRYGVLYTVEVRCDAPSDKRCIDDNYALGLTAKTTTVVLGAAARAEAGLGG